MRNVNLDDLAITIDFWNTLIRLSLSPSLDTYEDLQSQYDIIKYRSHQTINDTYGGKYESNKQWKKESIGIK